MQRKRIWWLTAAAILLASGWSLAQPSFDKLSKEDHAAFQERFAKEVWPLLKLNGKDSCLGCHSGKVVSDLRLVNDPAKDFATLLKKGYFVPNDPGSLLSRVEDTNPRRKMPPGKLPAWEKKEMEVLRSFVADLDKKQKK